MRTKLTKIALAAALVLAITFTLSCSSDGDDGVAFNENSQVYNEDGTEYKGDGDIKDASTNFGSVTNGVVKLNLPETVPDEHFDDNDFDKLSEEFGCNFSQKNVKYRELKFRLYNSNGERIGSLYAGYRDEQISESLTYLYFIKSIKGTCSYKDGDNDRKMHIDAKKGWNKTYEVRKCTSYNNENSKCDVWNIESSTNNILTREVKWILDK
jgi:hypothetical protein